MRCYQVTFSSYTSAEEQAPGSNHLSDLKWGRSSLSWTPHWRTGRAPKIAARVGALRRALLTASGLVLRANQILGRFGLLCSNECATVQHNLTPVDPDATSDLIQQWFSMPEENSRILLPCLLSAYTTSEWLLDADRISCLSKDHVVWKAALI